VRSGHASRKNDLRPCCRALNFTCGSLCAATLGWLLDKDEERRRAVADPQSKLAALTACLVWPRLLLLPLQLARHLTMRAPVCVDTTRPSIKANRVWGRACPRPSGGRLCAPL